MNKKTSKFLIISIILNVIMFMILCGVAYYKREGIKNRITKIMAFQNNLKTENMIKSMNQEVFIPVFGKYENGEKVIKIAFIGNSITLHGIAENIGWTHESGMAASKLENDYVHLLIEKIALNKNVSIEYAIVNTSGFERNFEIFDYARLNRIKEFSPDYVIFQLGENVSNEDIKDKYDLFIDKYTKLINNFNKSEKIVCLPFWYDKNKISAITEVAISTESFLVDLSHLGNGLDTRNFASSEVNYSHKGVAIHPGNYGMQNIAQNIFSVFNATIK